MGQTTYFYTTSIPPIPAKPSGFYPQHLNNLLDSFWPMLTDGIGPNQKKRDHQSVVREFHCMPKILVPELKEDGTLRFPWAARMDPATRNLYRAAKPNFRLDGTLQSTVASNQSVLPTENQELSSVSAKEVREELTAQTLEQGLEPTKESCIEKQSQLNVELKELSIPVNNLTYSKPHPAIFCL
ncbi:hypothetical protein HID58_064798 [Brassica napus]|uniref:Uncharacterized protein n=1 Tax=Brassica napus TaxID=3708 RepID=A0ABQ7ZB89_BRANA|nr:hypothetical protein HID58_064798 [Brassica napus]